MLFYKYYYSYAHYTLYRYIVHKITKKVNPKPFYIYGANGVDFYQCTMHNAKLL